MAAPRGPPIGAVLMVAIVAASVASASSAPITAAAANPDPASSSSGACASLGPGASACWLADPARDELTVTAAFAPPKRGQRLAWAALGLSELGGMSGADIWELTRSGEADAANSDAVNSANAGRVASPQSAPFWVVTDAHAPGFERPIPDAKQDVTLSAFGEGAQAARELWLASAPVKAVIAAANGNSTSEAAALALAPSAANALTVVLKRRLVTCDESEDMQLRYGRPLFWIWARGAQEDEEGGNGGNGPTRVSYHGADPLTRGAVLAAPWGPQPPGVTLLGPGQVEALRQATPVPLGGAANKPAATNAAAPTPSLIPANAKSLDVTIGGELSLPAGEETVYAVRAVKLPSDKKYHAVAYAPLFHEPFVHHAVLYACSDEAAATLDKRFGADSGKAGAATAVAMSPGRAASVSELRARSGAGKGKDVLRWRPLGGGDADWQPVAAEESGTAEGGPSSKNATFAGCMRFWALGAPTGGAAAMAHHGGSGGAGDKKSADLNAAMPPSFVAPPGTGIPFGGPSLTKGGKPWWPTHLLVEMHYNNPGGEKDLVDRNSGMRIYYVEENDSAAATAKGQSSPQAPLTDLGLLTGAQYALSIPPGLPSFTAPPSVCSAACTARALGKAAPQGITIVGRTYHMHGLGKSALTRRFRPQGGAQAVLAAAKGQAAAAAAARQSPSSGNSTAASAAPSSMSPLRLAETPPINELERYDYNYQAFLPPIKDGVSDRIMPGDALLTTWTFDSSSRKNLTRFGSSTQDEMAFDWLMYYPAVPELASCLSLPLRGVAKAMLERAAAKGGGGRSGIAGNGTASIDQEKKEALDWAAGAGSGGGGGNSTAAASGSQKQALQQALEALPATLAICSRDDAWGAQLFGGLAKAARMGGGAATEEVKALLKRLYESGDAVPAFPDPALMAAAGGGGGGGAAGAKEAAAPKPPGVKACSADKPAP